MDFHTASDRISEARDTTRRWNRRHDDQFVPWEWVEEAVISAIKYTILSSQVRHQEAQEWHDRYQEYVRHIPSGLRQELMI